MKYIIKSIIIEAKKWEGNNDSYIDISKFLGYQPTVIQDRKIKIETKYGEIVACVGDFIIRSIEGNYYPCKPENIF